ncbi:MAG: folate-binding protein YgfZ [Gammaproteobacteria bacterium]
MKPITFTPDLSTTASEHARSFGIAEALKSTPETPLGYTGLEVAGSDAATFLQGQMTANVTALSIGQCQLSALCEPKGRVIAQMDILRTGEEAYALILAHRLAAAVITTLKKYLMRSKVTITPWPEQPGFSLRTADNAPAQGQGYLGSDQIVVCRPTWLPLNDPKWVLTNGSTDAGEAEADPRDLTWAHAHVLFGIAPPVTATDLQYIPQMLNLDILEGISMTKGCYTGQEIIARVHHRGSVKRRLRRFLVDGNSDIEIGHAVEDEAGSNAGSIVEVALDDDGQLAVLAVVKESAYSPEATLGCHGATLRQWNLHYEV